MLSRGRSVRRSLLVAAASTLAFAFGAPAAEADVRAAHLDDGVDPTAAFDVRRIDVAVDRGTGTLSLAIQLGSPAPQVTSYTQSQSLTVNVSKSKYCPTDSKFEDSLGDTYISIRPVMTRAAQGFTYPLGATANVAYRNDYPDVPLGVSADGLTYSVQVTDELLKQSDPRCLEVDSSGRKAYDATQPGGGPEKDEIDGVWFDGQDPALPQNRVFAASTAADGPQVVRTASGKYRKASARARCSIVCTATVKAHATRSGSTKKLRGVTFSNTLKLPEKASSDKASNVYVTFSSRARRGLNAEFKARGRATLVVDFTFTDPIGRKVTRRQRIALKSAPKPVRRRSRSSSNGGSSSPGTPSSSGGDRDCSDFSSQAAAQRYFEAGGGSASNNFDRLDADGDGIACEANG